MNHQIGPIFVIAITVIACLCLFFMSDHSGIAVGDLTFDYVGTEDEYNLTYYLRVGINYNILDCQYSLYDDNNQLILCNSTIIREVYTGNHIISEILSINKTSDVKNITIDVYDYRVDNHKSKGPIYSKTFNITN